MKRICSVLLVFCLAAGILAGFTSSAEEDHLYYTSSLNEEQNLLSVSLYTDGLNWTALDFGLTFDPDVIVLSSVTVGNKILAAKARGFDFLTMSMDETEANARGFCNFVAAVGSSTCRMTAYAGAVVTYTFTVHDLSRARASFGLCVASLTDAQGKPLLDYVSYQPNQTPVPYLTGTAALFRPGDVDRNGDYSIFDAMLIMQQLVGVTELNESQLAAAKVSGSEELSIFDAMLVMQYLVGAITTFPSAT